MRFLFALVLATLTFKVSAQPQMSEACKAAFPKCRDNMQDHEKMKQCMEQNGCTMPAGGPHGGGMPGGPGGHGGMPSGGPVGGKVADRPVDAPAQPEVKPEAKITPKPKALEATGESASKVNCAQVTDGGRQNPKAELGERGSSTGNNNSASAQ